MFSCFVLFFFGLWPVPSLTVSNGRQAMDQRSLWPLAVVAFFFSCPVQPARSPLPRKIQRLDHWEDWCEEYDAEDGDNDDDDDDDHER